MRPSGSGEKEAFTEARSPVSEEIVKGYVRESLSSLTPRHFEALSTTSLICAHLRQLSLGHLRPITSYHLQSPQMPHRSRFLLLGFYSMDFSL